DNRYHQAPAFKILRSVYEFEEPVREAVHRLKYGDKIALAQPLARLLHNYLRQPPVQDAPKLPPIPHDQLALLIPVPLHPWRHYRRGYNQSTLLARALGQLMQVPVGEILRRTRHTTPQVELSAKNRMENVRGAFALDEAMVKKLTPGGGPMLLLDDVCTTGSTLRECAGVLKKFGFKEVYALTLARQL
ncbi:MAG: ComF family protein, partial [Abitibacteriaceae bacterium]|nr:ComF family protein [Abditibacteriaceae bacterium]